MGPGNPYPGLEAEIDQSDVKRDTLGYKIAKEFPMRQRGGNARHAVDSTSSFEPETDLLLRPNRASMNV
jgi:hypothetical protein